jgi:hypothetical protein
VVTFGLVIGLIVYLVGRASALSSWAVWFLRFWGFLSTAYIGFRPDDIDWAKKAQQTAVVAEGVYIVLMIILYVLA